MAGRVNQDSQDGRDGGQDNPDGISSVEMEPCIIECAQGGGTKKGSPDTKRLPRQKIEQVMGIRPTYLAWKASVLPLNYTCMKSIYLIIIRGDRIQNLRPPGPKPGALAKLSHTPGAGII